MSRMPMLRLLGLAFVGLSLLITIAAPAGASDERAIELAQEAELAQEVDASNQIRILAISGLIDPVLSDFILTELDQAEADGVLALVLTMDSNGTVLNDEDYLELATRLDQASVQIARWIETGGAALGGSGELLGTADVIGVSVGARIGETGDRRLPDSFGDAFGDATDRLQRVSISAEEAITLGISTGPLENASVLRIFVQEIPGYVAPTPTDEDPEGLSQARFVNLSLTQQLFHTVSSPEVAYLFFVGGLAILIFELFVAGVGVAGMIGAAMLALGSYGLGALPTRWWGIALLIAALVAMAIDIQTNVPRLYSALGIALFVLGTWFLYDGVTMSWLTGLFGIVGAVLYAYTGMPSMVRTRFSTPTIGRKWMIGKLGEATSDLRPDGTIVIDDTPWQAITNRATPLSAGDRVRVVGIDRLLLEVEPEEGGARDYRERATSDE